MAKLISIVPGSGLIYFSGATSSTLNFRANSTTNNLDFFHGNNAQVLRANDQLTGFTSDTQVHISVALKTKGNETVIDSGGWKGYPATGAKGVKGLKGIKGDSNPDTDKGSRGSEGNTGQYRI